MAFFIILAFLAGCGVGWFFWWTARREAVRLDEEKQMLQQEQAIVFDFMHNMVEAIGEGMDRQHLLERVVHAAILSTGALSACIFERVHNDLRGVAVEGLFPPHRAIPSRIKKLVTTRAKFLEQILKSEVFQVGEGLVGKAALTGRGILIEDARGDPRIIQHDDPALVVRSVIVVPISFRDRNLAVLAIVNPADSGSFGETDFSLAKSLAEQAGLAIHNLDLMSLQIEKNKLDHDLSLARDIQDMLLPKEFPNHGELDMAAIYRPAQKVGGDLYDIFPLADDRIGVAIADVSGKGVPASLLMTICHTNLRHLSRQFSSPARVLKELNHIMEGETRSDMFVTMIFAVIDLRKGEIVFARAGHELPIFAHQGETDRWESDLLESDGMAIGMVPAEIFDDVIEDRSLPFQKGDILQLYTDGVTEAANKEGIEFSNNRLCEAVARLHNHSAEEINQSIFEDVTRFSSRLQQADDFTLVTVKRRST